MVPLMSGLNPSFFSVYSSCLPATHMHCCEEAVSVSLIPTDCGILLLDPPWNHVSLGQTSPSALPHRASASVPNYPPLNPNELAQVCLSLVLQGPRSNIGSRCDLFECWVEKGSSFHSICQLNLLLIQLRMLLNVHTARACLLAHGQVLFIELLPAWLCWDPFQGFLFLLTEII